MSDSAVIKEFLVGLGFKLDTNSLGKMEGAIGKVSGMAFAFAASLAGAAATMTAFVAKMAGGAEDLYWASVRTRDSVANIRDFQLQISKFGGSAEGALQALEAMGTYLRTNPAGESYLRYLGVQTRELHNGRMELKSSRDLLTQLANLPLPYWLKAQVGARFGLDEKTLLAIRNGALETEPVVANLWKRAGLNAQEAAQKEHDYENALKDTDARWTGLSHMLAVTFLPVAERVTNWTERAIDWFVALNKKTDGTAAQFAGVLAGGIGVFLGTAVLAAPAIYTMSKTIGVLTGAFSALRGALVAIGLVGEATPLGWIVTGVALFGVLAYELYQHWDGVKSWWNGAVAWFRDKYNAVAPFLRLPRWEAPAATPQAAVGPPATPQAAVALPTTPEATERRVARVQAIPTKVTLDRAAISSALPAVLVSQRVSRGFPAASPAEGVPQSGAVGHALDFFRQAGWSPEQSAGIVANLIRESGLRNVPGDFDKKTGRPEAFGIAQWHPARQAAFAAMFGHGVQTATMDEQLAFVNHELRHGVNGVLKAAGGALSAATTAAQAGAIVSRLYEAPKDASGEAFRRADIAEGLMRNRPITTGGNGDRNININQKTDIQVSSNDPATAGRSVAREQGRVNGDLVRNLSGSIQ